MTSTEIQATIDDFTANGTWQSYFSNSVGHHFKDTSSPDEERVWYLDPLADENDSRSDYDRLLVHATLSKPTEQELSDAFDLWKPIRLADLETQKQDALDDELRAELRERVSSISVDIRAVATRRGVSVPNPLKWIMDKADELDETEVAAWEAEVVNVEADQAAYDAREATQANIRAKRKKIDQGLDIIAMMNYLNDQKGVTEAEVGAMLADANIQAAMGLLQTGSLQTARTTIAGMDISGIVVTEADRTQLLDLLDEYIGA